MADILYTYKNQVYANITNECDCNCTFCIRSHEEAVGEARSMWHQSAPSLQDITQAMDHFDFSTYKELVYCGYGEPTCALDNLIASARYAKERYDVAIRVNTNGLCNLYHKTNVIPILAQVVDSISISLNAPTSEEYNQVTRPAFSNAFDGMLAFAAECKKSIPSVQMTVVDILAPEKIEACRKLCESINVTLRIRSYA